MTRVEDRPTNTLCIWVGNEGRTVWRFCCSNATSGQFSFMVSIGPLQLDYMTNILV